MIIRARAPLRLGLGGGGTDVSPYCDQFGGAVINATIDRYAFASFEPRSDGRIVFHASDLDLIDETEALDTLESDAGLRLHRGVYNRMVTEFNGGRRCPMTIVTHVDSPLGSGLGSSSALVVALVVLLAEVFGAPLGEYEVARIAFEVERKDLKLNGGRQDHYAAAFGGFNFLEFGAEDHVIVNPLRVRESTKLELESSLVLFFTGASRESATIIDHQISSVAENGDPLRAMHRLKEDAIAMKNALLMGDVREMSKVLAKSWESKKATSTAVSSRSIDAVIASAINAGALAGKVSGAGGGGFIMFLVDPAKRADVIRALRKSEGHADVARFTAEPAATWRPRL